MNNPSIHSDEFGLVIMLIKNQKSMPIPFGIPYDEKSNYTVSVTVTTNVEFGNKKKFDEARYQFDRFVEQCLSLKGRPYLGGWFSMNQKQKDACYGDDYLHLKKLKKEIDPGNILNPGIWV
ncbi:hypothetical protein KKA14_04275 [bacterium]|nr:hypothetical protein [bacterium]